MVAFLLLPHIFLFDSASAQSNTRTWTSNDGRDAIEASFENYDSRSKQVSLKLDTGDLITVALNKLSQADRRFVIRIARKNGKASANEKKRDGTPHNRKTRAPGIVSLYGIDWTPGLNEATKAAAGGKSATDDCPVMWTRVLGEIEGFM